MAASTVATYPNSPVSSSTKIPGGIVLQRFKCPAVLRGVLTDVLTQELVSDVFATVLVVGLLAALCMVPA